MFLKADPNKELYHTKHHDWPIYSGTSRPVSRMLGISQEGGLISDRLYLPVVRYPGLYHSSNNEKYCGKFYYFEPESSVLLDLGRTMVFASKVHAHHILLSEVLKHGGYDILWYKDKAYVDKHDNIDNVSMKFIYEYIFGWKYIKRINGMDKEGMIECMKSYYFTLVDDPNDVPFIECADITPFYPTDESPHWDPRNFPTGIMDSFDQPICQYAKFLGIDTVVLQHEKGEKRSVSEVLDTRDDSYEYLTTVSTLTSSWFDVSPRYNTIWFPSYGFVSDEPSEFEIGQDGVVRTL